MSKNRSQNILLAEIMIAVLFFALCSTVILEVFVAAKEYRAKAEMQSEALVVMRDVAERIYAADEMEDLLTEAGFQLEADEWVREETGYELKIAAEEKMTSAGVIRSARVGLWMDDCLTAELPVERYIPGGVSE